MPSQDKTDHSSSERRRSVVKELNVINKCFFIGSITLRFRSYKKCFVSGEKQKNVIEL